MMLSMFNTLILILAFSLNLSAQTVITSSSRLSWNQTANSLIIAQGLSYIVYIDDTIRRSLENVICSGAMSPFSCNSKFPSFLAPGIHNLQITATDVAESSKSPIFNIQIAAPTAPSNLGIVSIPTSNNGLISCGVNTMPLGIPCPSFGIEELDPGRPIGWPGSQVAKYYYIDNSVTCTDVGNTYGWPNNPRCSIPSGATPYPSGSRIEVHGGPYSPGGTQFQTTFTNCTALQPCFMIGVGTAGNKTITLSNKLGSIAVGCNRTVFGITGCVEIQDRQWIYLGSYFIIEGFFSNGRLTVRGDMRPFTGSAPDHYALRNIEITAPHKFTGGCMTGVLSVQWVIFRNHLHDCGDYIMAATEENDDQGIQLTSGQTVWIIENEIYHNGGDGIGINAGQVEPINRSRFSYIGRNHIWENGENIIDIKTAEDVIFTSNVVHTVHDSAASDGAAIVLNDENITPTAADWRIFIFNNIIYDAIIGIRSQTQSYVFGNLIYNTSDLCFGSFGNSSMTTWENNTCVDTKGLVHRFGGSTDITLRLRNNLYSSSFTMIERASVENAATIDPLTDIRNNQFPLDGSDTYRWAGSIVNTLTSWQALTGGRAINNKLGIDGFVNASSKDYSLSVDASAINQGTSSLLSYDKFFILYGIEINYDINGTKRPINSWDIGAYEFK